MIEVIKGVSRMRTSAQVAAIRSPYSEEQDHRCNRVRIDARDAQSSLGVASTPCALFPT